MAGADIPLDSDIGRIAADASHRRGHFPWSNDRSQPFNISASHNRCGAPKPGAPVIGGHVDIGAGAKILGGVTIGDHARIGANAVVLGDVPSGAIAVGVPARIVPGRKPILSQDETAQTESDAWGLSLVHDTSDRLAS